MVHKTFYYARVSTREQNLDRQLEAFRALGANDREIITDKESGKNLDRPGYQALKSAMLRSGDTLYVDGLDSLGSTLEEIAEEWRSLTKDLQVDVVVLDGYTNLGKPLVKRIIACEGDTVELDTEKGLVYVNGQALEEPYTAEPTYEAGDMTGQITVPEGCVFVMGDNRNHSTDSRFSDVGFVDSRDILGRVLLRIFPMDQFGGIA